MIENKRYTTNVVDLFGGKGKRIGEALQV